MKIKRPNCEYATEQTGGGDRDSSKSTPARFHLWPAASCTRPRPALLRWRLLRLVLHISDVMQPVVVKQQHHPSFCVTPPPPIEYEY